MTLINGADTGPLAGWVIVTEQGIRMLGKKSPGIDGWSLCPVYELLVGFGMTPQGHMQVTRQAIPIMTFASIESWTPNPMSSVLEAERLSAFERRDLLRAVMIAEQIVKGMRGAESGISIATDMPKIDPGKLLRKP